jgi:hypothetical protein
VLLVAAIPVDSDFTPAVVSRSSSVILGLAIVVVLLVAG